IECHGLEMRRPGERRRPACPTRAPRGRGAHRGLRARPPGLRPTADHGYGLHMSHPDPNGPPDLRPIRVGEAWENPVTGEYSTILELPYKNPEGRATAEMTASVGPRVVGEHLHPS